ncbi:MAG: DNA replication/repair protein RecF [Candidatus Hinthialibacter antarcticus]|nr:DNA replication/repair protein RecF [Candidatus Hinthialibacter antarcticus]
MYLSSLLIRNFRLIQDASLEFGPGLHLALGLNAQGKTSLIEAVVFLSTSTSHRTRKEEELIRWGDDTAFLRGVVDQNGQQETLSCGVEKKRKVVKVDDQPLPRISDLYGRLRTVLFAPEDLIIVAGSPQERRRFIDMAIAQIDSEYIPLLQQYRRLVKQRNHVLRRMQLDKRNDLTKELDVWNHPFLDAAAQVAERRGEFIDQIAPLLERFYAGLADDGPCRIEYPAAAPGDAEAIREDLAKRLERTRAKEIDRGSTQLGPHRDDAPITLDGKSLAQFGSQGQRRAASLALRLAEADNARNAVGAPPVLLIDDVVYEMDNTRRKRFWDNIDFSGQLIVTATDKDHLGATLNPTQTFEVSHGAIRSYSS